MKIIAVLLILLLFFSILFSFSSVQSGLAKRATNYVNNKYQTNISIDKVDLSYLGQINLENVLISDSQNDTIISVHFLKTSLLSVKQALENKTNFNRIYLTDAKVVMRTYEGEEEDELKQFVNKLKNEKKTNKKREFNLTSDQIVLENGDFILIDENKQKEPIVYYNDIFGKVNDFKIQGTSVKGNIKDLQLVDNHGLQIENLTTDFSYSKTNMHFLNTRLLTVSSDIEGDINLTYEDGDLSDFVNKVQIDADFRNADVSLKDLQGFYDELGTKDIIHFSSNIKGTLNDFRVKNLRLYSDQNSRINGDLHLINSFNKGKGFQLVADLNNLESDYEHLKNLLPNILGKTLPESFKLLGHFSMDGKSHITKESINAKLNIQSAIGNIQSDLVIRNFDNINNANYKGKISLHEIELGKLLKDPLIGNISMDSEVAGKGFTLEHLDTQVKGKILKYKYRDYTYKDIDVQGNVKDKLFSGNIKANDPNIKFDFEGLADLSKEKYKFDFISHVEHIKFNKLHLIQRDSIAILKGDIKMAMVGNTLENMVGNVQFTNATYTNQIQDYHFKDFIVNSTIKDSIQTLKINSTDIVNGQIKGKFIYKELSKLAQNAFGSIYTNYVPYEVSPKQYLDFRFKIYNQVVAVFFPDVKLGTNTSIRGQIDSDNSLFKLTFKSPEVLAYDNYIESIRLQIDNQNPLFNTQLSVDKIETKLYDIAELDLVNITLNDTLQFRTEFKGGKSLKDKYNLAFYHTFNKENQSILGFQKSDITFNKTDWLLNPSDNEKNKLIYDNQTKKITYQDFLLTYKGQQLLFYGEQQGEDFQNYNIDLDRIELAKILPDIKNFDFKGLINGGIWIEKRNNMLIPTADVQLMDFYVNDIPQGDLIGEIKGTETNKKYDIDLYLEKNDFKSIVSKGSLDFLPKKSTIDLDINFDNFQINILNALGKDVMQDIRGAVSGEASIKGLLKNPDFSGLLTLNDAGIFFPYINIDYGFENNTSVRLNNQSFIIDNAKIFDTLFETTGDLSGSISHNSFKKWYLDLQIDTDNLLAINTPEEEEILFYGTGYLDGTATFIGNTDNVNIAINGNSNPGTEIIIPMSDLKTVESSKLIHFKLPKTEEVSTSSLRQLISERFKGVTMDFNLGITKDATLQIVIDQSTGSSLQGNGTGNIQMDIDTKGTFNMYGEYIVDKGFYNFKYGGIINKPFIVKKGGTISFTGDPYKAELDIEAIYSTKANPKAILPEYESSSRISVDLITKLTGELFNSKQEFDIDVPNASVDLTSELEFLLNDQDYGNMMLQFVSLLATGSFFNVDNDIRYASSSLVNDIGISSVAMAVSNALLNIFSDPNDKLQFGIDYSQGNKIIDTENQLGVLVATRLGKNEKIIINGEVNVPTGSQSNANIAGNVSVELPLNKNESLRMKVFNRQNEIQYTDEVQGYTQGLGISWQVNFDNRKELLEKMGLTKVKEKIDDENRMKQDSIPEKQLIEFKLPSTEKEKNDNN